MKRRPVPSGKSNMDRIQQRLKRQERLMTQKNKARHLARSLNKEDRYDSLD